MGLIDILANGVMLLGISSFSFSFYLRRKETLFLDLFERL